MGVPNLTTFGVAHRVIYRQMTPVTELTSLWYLKATFGLSAIVGIAINGVVAGEAGAPSGVPGPMPPGVSLAGKAAVYGPVGPWAARKVPAGDSAANYGVLTPCLNRVSIVGATTPVTGKITVVTSGVIAVGRPGVVNGTPDGNLPSTPLAFNYRSIPGGGLEKLVLFAGGISGPF